MLLAVTGPMASAAVLGAVKGRALGRAPQAVSSLDRSCAPGPDRGVGTKGVPTLRPRLRRGRTKGGSIEGSLRRRAVRQRDQ